MFSNGLFWTILEYTGVLCGCSIVDPHGCTVIYLEDHSTLELANKHSEIGAVMITNKNFAKRIHNMKPSAPEINTKLQKVFQVAIFGDYWDPSSASQTRKSGPAFFAVPGRRVS